MSSTTVTTEREPRGEHLVDPRDPLGGEHRRERGAHGVRTVTLDDPIDRVGHDGLDRPRSDNHDQRCIPACPVAYRRAARSAFARFTSRTMPYPVIAAITTPIPSSRQRYAPPTAGRFDVQNPLGRA